MMFFREDEKNSAKLHLSRGAKLMIAAVLLVTLVNIAMLVALFMPEAIPSKCMLSTGNIESQVK